jgi:threonine dehydrogenase-like Zn-dependent dehydrogenase
MHKGTFAAVIFRNGRLSFEHEKISSYNLSKEHVVVAPISVGVCSSDLRELRGERHTEGTFGHELVGRVVSVSGGVRFNLGDLVVHNPNVPIQRSSGFAELFFASGATDEALSAAFHTVPDDIALDALIFAEPLAAAVRCVRKLKAHARTAGVRLERVGVIGAGVFGLLIALEAEANGFAVTVFNRSLRRIAFAQRASSRFAKINFEQLDSSPSGLDTVVIATNEITLEIWAAGVAHLRVGGLMHLFGGTHPGLTLLDVSVNLDAVRRNESCVTAGTTSFPLWVGGSHGADRKDMSIAISRLRDPVWRDAVQGLIVERTNLSLLAGRLSDLAISPYIGRLVLDLPTCEFRCLKP